MKTWFRWQDNRPTHRDIVLALGIALLTFALSSRFELYERFTAQTRHLERWQVDEMPVAFLAFSLCCVWLLLRRARELAVETATCRQMAQALQESESHYRAVVEGSLQGIYIQSGFVVQFANQALARIFGYDSPEALLGQELWVLVAPHERSRLAGYSQACFHGDVAPFRYEWQGQRQDGTCIWLESLVSRLSWNGHTALLTAVVDITARKWQEEERGQIVYDLHDSIAQLLVSAQQHLETFDALQHDDVTLAQRQLDLGRQRLQRAIVETRRLMARLRPTPLEFLGLIPAVRQYLEEVGQEAGWEVECRVDTADVFLLPEQEMALFRIVQEAVTNVWKHANTPRLSLELKTIGDSCATLSIVVKDWGTGFQPDRVRVSTQHLGLLSMRERARMLGGTCTITSRPGQGTTVHVSIPMQHGEEV
jgi:PAS domain S-box-containing protein